ncbi:MAG: hypothetical protein IKK58_01330 [Clostridia bacterium]|nr:hypothetical protein [Clostridia bacterium]
MKKFFALMVSIAIICALGITAMAAPVSVGYTTVFLGDLFVNVPESATTVAQAGFWAIDGGLQSLSVSNGKITFTSAGWGSFGSFSDPTVGRGQDGWCYYLENGGDDVAILASGFNGEDGKGFKLINEASYVLVDLQGNVDEKVGVWASNFSQGAIELPSGFKGWVYIPFDQYEINDESGSGAKFDNANQGVAAASFAISSATNVTFGGEFYAYSGEMNSTADVSVLAYAAVALTGLGALVVAKKR